MNNQTYMPLMGGQNTMMNTMGTMQGQPMWMPQKKNDNTIFLLIAGICFVVGLYFFLSSESGKAFVGGDSESKTGSNSNEPMVDGNGSDTPSLTAVANHAKSQAITRAKTWVGAVDATAWAEEKTPTKYQNYNAEPAGLAAYAYAWPTATSITTLRTQQASRCTVDQLSPGDLLISESAGQVIIFESWANASHSEYNLVYLSPSGKTAVATSMPYPFLTNPEDGKPWIEGLVPYCLKSGWFKPFEVDPNLPLPPSDQEYKDGMGKFTDGRMFDGTTSLWNGIYDSVDKGWFPSEGRYSPDGCAANEVSLVPGGPCYGKLSAGSRNITHIAVHTTVSNQSPDNLSMTGNIISYWKNTLNWSRNGYHFIVRPNGKVHSLEPTTKISNGVSGNNNWTVNISYIGGRSTPNCDNRTEAQKESIRKMVKRMQASFPNAQVLGHYQFPGVTKPCPCFDARAEYANIKDEDKTIATYWKSYSG